MSDASNHGPFAERTASREASPRELDSRTHLALLFVDLSDSTRLSGVMEAETFAAMLGDVKRICRQAILARRGVLNQFQGDGLQAVFGYPTPSEHDAQRAAEAALEIHAGVRALRQGLVGVGAGDLSVHSGLHAGPALVRAGDDMSGQLELYGPVPGIAKHLSDLAHPDELLVSEESLGPDLQQFDCEPTRFVELKGRAQPLPVRRVIALRARHERGPARPRPGLLPLLGRDSELTALAGWYAIARSQGPLIGRVVAPAGQGKTRVVEAFLERAAEAGDCVLRACGDADHTSLPLDPILQMLRELLALPVQAKPEEIHDRVMHRLRVLALPMDDAKPLCQALALDLQPKSISTAERTAMSASIRRMLCATAHRAPTVLFIDDWHWVDDATRSWVHDLETQGSGQLLVIIAKRPRETADLLLEARVTLDLGPLDEEAAQASVRTLLPGVDPFLARQIIEASGGNPLYLEELCRFAQGSLAADALPGALRRPAWLEALIANRLARLTPDARRVIDTAAVIGSHVPSALLSALSGVPPDAPELTMLAEEDMLLPLPAEEALRFKHGITREVTYGAVGLARRRELHRQLAEQVESLGKGSSVELLAYHHAGAGDYAKAAHYAALAGDRAMSMSAIESAKRHYRVALDSIDRLGQGQAHYLQWRSVVRRYGAACVYDPGANDIAIFELAIERGRHWEDAAGTAYAAYWLAYAHYALGATRQATAACALARDACQATADHELAMQVAAVHGQALAAQCHVLALPALEAVVAALASASQTPRDGSARRRVPGVAYMLACRASLIADRRGLAAAQADFERAIAEVPSTGHEVESSVLCLKSNALLWHGHWDEAAQAAQAAMNVATRVRSVYLLAMSSALRAWADWQRRGNLADLQALETATQWLDGNGKRLFISLNHGRLAQAHAESGDREKARWHAAQALRRQRQGDPFGAPSAWRALALLAARERQFSLAVRRLKRAEAAANARSAGHEQQLNARCRQVCGLA